MKNLIAGAIIMIAVMLNVSMVKGESTMIEQGSVVQMDYQLTVDGQVVDSSEGRGPLEYTQGAGMIIKGLEESLQGLKIGEEKHVVVQPSEGYGVVDENAIIEIPRQNLGLDEEPQEGMILQLQNQTGQSMAGKIVEVKESSLMLDFNHPLAGKELVFDVKIVGIQ